MSGKLRPNLLRGTRFAPVVEERVGNRTGAANAAGDGVGLFRVRRVSAGSPSDMRNPGFRGIPVGRAVAIAAS